MSRQITPVDQAVRPLYAGIDVGGTNIKIGIVDDLGQTLAWQSIPTEEDRGIEDAILRMAAGVRSSVAGIGLGSDDIAAVGLATPGTMDIPAGFVLEPPNLPHWRNYPIRDRLSAALHKPVTFANDANAAAYGEFWIGSGRDHKSLAMLTLGTGVGGGIIYDGISIDGMHSHGSECGHMIIDYHDNARMCPCGGRGHLEAYASATALVKRCQEALDTGRPSSLNARLQSGEELTTLMMAQAAEQGDALAQDIILETCTFLAAGVVGIIHCIDPGLVVLGGAMNFGGHDSALGRRFLSIIREQVRAKALPVPASRTVVDFAILGGDAGYIGAAGLARAAFRGK